MLGQGLPACLVWVFVFLTVLEDSKGSAGMQQSLLSVANCKFGGEGHLNSRSRFCTSLECSCTVRVVVGLQSVAILQN